MVSRNGGLRFRDRQHGPDSRVKPPLRPATPLEAFHLDPLVLCPCIIGTRTAARLSPVFAPLVRPARGVGPDAVDRSTRSSLELSSLELSPLELSALELSALRPSWFVPAPETAIIRSSRVVSVQNRNTHRRAAFSGLCCTRLCCKRGRSWRCPLFYPLVTRTLVARTLVAGTLAAVTLASELESELTSS